MTRPWRTDWREPFDRSGRTADLQIVHHDVQLLVPRPQRGHAVVQDTAPRRLQPLAVAHDGHRAREPMSLFVASSCRPLPSICASSSPDPQGPGSLVCGPYFWYQTPAFMTAPPMSWPPRIRT